MKSHLPRVTLLLLVFTLKHWHSASFWYLFIRIIGWSETPPNRLSINLVWIRKVCFGIGKSLFAPCVSQNMQDVGIPHRTVREHWMYLALYKVSTFSSFLFDLALEIHLLLASCMFLY